MKLTVYDIAEICHENNRKLVYIIEDPTIPHAPPWQHAGNAQRDSVVSGVVNILEGRVTGPQESHESWLTYKRQEGWQWGPVKIERDKVHPLLVEWAELSEEHRIKDVLFYTTVITLAPLLAPLTK